MDIRHLRLIWSSVVSLKTAHFDRAENPPATAKCTCHFIAAEAFPVLAVCRKIVRNVVQLVKAETLGSFGQVRRNGNYLSGVKRLHEKI